MFSITFHGNVQEPYKFLESEVRNKYSIIFMESMHKLIFSTKSRANPFTINSTG
jgi:hypothetical protein